MGKATFTPQFQAGDYRWYDSDGGEAASTALAAEGSVPTLNGYGDPAVQLRLMIQETAGAGGASSDTYKIQTSTDASTWYDIDNASAQWVSGATAGLSDGSSTTNRGTDGLTDGSGSFIAGQQETGSTGSFTGLTLTASNFTECVWGIQFNTDSVTDGQTYYFKLQVNGVDAGTGLAAIKVALFNPSVTHYRWYDDGGSEAGSTPSAAEDTALSFTDGGGDSSHHLRFNLVGGAYFDASFTITLQTRINGGSWANVPTTSGNPVYVDSGSSLSDGVTTTNRSTNGLTDPIGGTFVSGTQEETSPTFATISNFTAANRFSEYVIGLTIEDASVSSGDTIEFQLTISGTDLNAVTNTVTPTINVVSGGTTHAGAGSLASQLDSTASGIMLFKATASAASQLDATGAGVFLFKASASGASQLDAVATGSRATYADGSAESQLDAEATGAVVVGGTTHAASGTASAQADADAIGGDVRGAAGSMASQLDSESYGYMMFSLSGVSDGQLDSDAVGSAYHHAVGLAAAQVDAVSLGFDVRGVSGSSAAQLDVEAVGTKALWATGTAGGQLDATAAGSMQFVVSGSLTGWLWGTGNGVKIVAGAGSLAAQLDMTGVGAIYLPSILYEPVTLEAVCAATDPGVYVPVTVSDQIVTAGLTATLEQFIINHMGQVRIYKQ